jgi:nucleoside permease NupC
VIIGVAFLASNHRSRIPWRTVAVGLFAQVAFPVLVLRWSVGKDVLDFVAGQVEALIGYPDAGIEFMFGELVSDKQSTIFAFVAYSDFGPKVKSLSDQTVVVVTFALAGFANFSSIAVQIGAIGGLAPSAADRPPGACRRF